MATIAYILANANFFLVLEFPGLPVAYLTLGWLGLVFIGGLMFGLRPFWRKKWQYLVITGATWMAVFIFFWVHLYFGLFQIAIKTDQSTLIFALTRAGRFFLLLIYLPVILILIFWQSWSKEVDHYFGKSARYLKILIALMLAVSFGALTHLYFYSQINSVLSLLAYLLNGLMIASVAFFISRAPATSRRFELPVKQSAFASSSILIYLGIYFLISGGLLKLFITYDGFWQSIFRAVSIAGIAFLALLLTAGKQLRQAWIQLVQKLLIVPKYDFREELSRFTRAVSQAKDEKACIQAILKTVRSVFHVNNAALCLVQPGVPELRIIRLEEGQGVSEAGILKNLPKKKLRILLQYAKEHDIQPVARLQELIQDRETGQYLDTFRVFLPIQAGEQLIGLLLLGAGDEATDFDYEDRQLLQLFTNAIGIALHRIQLYEDLMLAKQQEAMSRLASYVLHELRNNTSILSLLVQNAKKNFQKPDFQKEFLKGVAAVSGEMHTLIRKIGAFKDGKIEVQRKPVNLHQLIWQISQELQIPEKFELQMDIPDEIVAHWDRELIKMSFRNLLMNSIEAMPDGGKIEISAIQTNHHLRIQIQDWGSGMSKAFIKDHLFRPYDTTKPHGLGLGMHQAREIIQAHEGSIRVQSQPGKGTTVIIDLPLGQRQQIQQSKVAAKSIALA
ncbi:MAG: ATP-binding protein [candidate division KSB1 bacterium]|nr:ATP-binding protein [candidate division KSB1 bacterium]